MKTAAILVVTLMTLSMTKAHAQGSESRTMVCNDHSRKIGLKTDSTLFYESAASVSDQEVATEKNENSEGSVSYNAKNDQFEVNNSKGCVPLKYTIKTDSDRTQATVTNEDDFSQSEMNCHWL